MPLLVALDSLPAVESRLEQIRLLSDVFADLSAFPNRSSDRQALTGLLNRWLEELNSHPISEEDRIADLSRIARISRQRDIALPGLAETVQGWADEWRHPNAADPRRNIQSRQLAYRLLEGTWEALGQTGRNLFQDLLDDLARDATSLEAQAREAEPQARIQALGEVAALYRLLSSHPEAGEPFRGAWRQSLGEILAAGRSEEIPPSLRLEIQCGVLQEFESGGAESEARALREAMQAQAETALTRGRNRRASIADRYQALLEGHGVFRALGDSAGVQRSAASLRHFSAELEVVAAEQGPELQRQVNELSLEAYLEIGDLDAAEGRLEELRRSLAPELERSEAPSADDSTIDPRAQALLRLGNAAQRLAAARSELSGEESDLSIFREILADLSALGERSGQATMALYGRFMSAVLDQDPTAESIQRELQEWRPESFAVWDDTPALFLPDEVRNYVADPFQSMAEEIWRIQGPISLLPRAAATLQFLGLLVEGNHDARRAAAEAANQPTAPIAAERDRMRRYLSHVQSLIASGRAGSTREAIQMLPEILGEERAAEDFYRSIERAFASTDLAGREVGAGNLASRLIDSEGIADPEVRAQAWLSLAREMIVADSLNHRADAMIGSLLESAEQIGGRGRAPRSLLQILGSLAAGSRDLDDLAELHDRMAGNETLRQQIQGTRDAGLYVQAMNQVVDSVFSVEGGAVILASIFTAGIAAELAGGAMLTRLGSGAFTVVNGVRRMTWTARLAVGASRLGAAWLARSATELGGIAAYRSWTGRRAMSWNEARVRLITSLFCSVGDEFAGHLTRALVGRVLAQSHAVTATAEFFASGLGEMWGEDVGARVAGQDADNRPFLVRYFEETLHGSFFVAGTRAAGPLVGSLQHLATPRAAASNGQVRGLLGSGATATLLTMAGGIASLLTPEVAHASLEVSQAAPSGSGWIGMGLGLGALAMVRALRPRRPQHPDIPILRRWTAIVWDYSGHDPTFVRNSATWARRFESGEISVDELALGMRRLIRASYPDHCSALLHELAMSFAENGLVEPVHRLLEEENFPEMARQAIPKVPNYWYVRDGEIRLTLMRAMIRQGIFEGEFNPLYQLNRLRDQSQRLQGWRILIEGLVHADRVAEAQELAEALKRNSEDIDVAYESIGVQIALHSALADRDRGSFGGGGILASSLLAAGVGAATLLSSASAQAQESLGQYSGPEWGGLLTFGGLLAAGLYYVYRHSEPIRLRNLRAQIDSVSESATAEERRELADWLFEEARGNREHFYDGSHYITLLQKIHVGNLAALDVYLRLLERNDPSARQLLRSRDRQAAERLILRQNLGGNGLGRLIYATLDARISASLMEELATRIDRPAVFTRIKQGILQGKYREGRILLRALELANPEHRESVEDLLAVLEGLEAKRYIHAGKFLDQVRARPELARWLCRGSGALTAMLAGGATWLSADIAQASASMGASADSPAWLTGIRFLLGAGILAVAASSGSRPPNSGIASLARGLFAPSNRIGHVEESVRDRFLLRFSQLSAQEKSERLAELQGALRELVAAGSPIAIHPPFLNTLLRDPDPAHAISFFNGLSSLVATSFNLGVPLGILSNGLERRGLPTIEPIRQLGGAQVVTPAWLRFREVIDEFPSDVDNAPVELSLRDVHLIQFLDNHGQGDGPAALNAIRRNILRRLHLQGWRPGRDPSGQELAIALLDDENHLPMVSRGDERGRRLLLNGHHRMGALLSLVADGFLSEGVLARIPFHAASEIEPAALIDRAFDGFSPPERSANATWSDLLDFDETSRNFVASQSLDQDIVGWIREVRGAEGSGAR